MFPARFHILRSASCPSYSGVFIYHLYLPGSPSRIHYQYISTTPVYSYSLDLILLLHCFTLLLLCHSTPVFPQPCLAPQALCAQRTHLGLWSLSTSDPPELPQSSSHLTLDPSNSTHTSFRPFVLHSCQLLVRPTCNRQVVNLPAGLDFSFLPSRHIWTPVGVPFVTSCGSAR